MNAPMFRKYCTPFLFVFLIFMACGEEKNERPEKILSQHDMALVIADIQLVESVKRIITNEFDFNGDSVDVYSPVFEQYGINRETFRESMRYYTQNPDQMEEIYQEVLVILSEKEATYQGVEIN